MLTPHLSTYLASLEALPLSDVRRAHAYRRSVMPATQRWLYRCEDCDHQSYEIGHAPPHTCRECDSMDLRIEKL